MGGVLPEDGLKKVAKSSQMDEMIQIQWTCVTLEEARRVAKLLVEKHLVACVNIVPEIESFFFWEGKCEQGREVKVWIKTMLAQFDAVRELIEENASYDLPEIIYVKIDGGNQAYLDWVAQNAHF